MKKVKSKKSKLNTSTVKEISEFFNRSEKWVYKHWEDIGGIKIGGAIMLPPLDVVAKRLFGKNKVIKSKSKQERTQNKNSEK